MGCNLQTKEDILLPIVVQKNYDYKKQEKSPQKSVVFHAFNQKIPLFSVLSRFKNKIIEKTKETTFNLKSSQKRQETKININASFKIYSIDGFLHDPESIN